MKTGYETPLRRMLNKVPEVTALFWLIKMMSTTVGETAADFLSSNLHFGLGGTTAVVGVLLLAALWGQLRARQYVPWLYWLSVVVISVFGTLLTDNLTDQVGISLAVCTGLFGIALVITFAVWHAEESTLSIQSVDTSRREWFYWTAILFTFALGTAAGDWVAEGLHLGYAAAALLFGGLIGLVAVGHYLLEINATTSFWMAYVLTRPFGSACGDLLAQPASNGGLGFGTMVTSALFLLTIVGLVGYLTATRKQLIRPR